MYNWDSHKTRIETLLSSFHVIPYLKLMFSFQAEFREINLAAYTESGTVVDIQVTRNGSKVVR